MSKARKKAADRGRSSKSISEITVSQHINVSRHTTTFELIKSRIPEPLSKNFFDQPDRDRADVVLKYLKVRGWKDLTNWVSVEHDNESGSDKQGVPREFDVHLGRSLAQLRNFKWNSDYLSKNYTNKAVNHSWFMALGKNILARLSGLQSLYLDFHSEDLSRNINNNALQLLGKVIGRHLINLSHLGLDLGQCEKIKDEGLIMFASRIGAPGYVNLKTLELSFSFPDRNWTGLTDKGLGRLGLIIGRRFINLENLKLKFKRCRKFTKKGVKGFATALRRRLTRLKKLDLEFSHSINDEGLVALLGGLGEQFQKLDCLSLSIDSGITSKALKILGEHLKQNVFVKMRQFSLRIADCSGIVLEDLSDLASAISGSLVSLERLSLNFWLCLMFAKGIHKRQEKKLSIRKKLSENISSLQEIDIEF